MSQMKISGSVTALGQHSVLNDGAIYAYVEITEDSGRRLMIGKVAVRNDVGCLLTIGATGQFFIDQIFVITGGLRFQLWGAKLNNGLASFDRKDMRTLAAGTHLIFGLLLLPFMGLGLPLLATGIVQLIKASVSSTGRSRIFYGNDPVAAAAVRRQETVRI
jgi:hypothetical protein